MIISVENIIYEMDGNEEIAQPSAAIVEIDGNAEDVAASILREVEGDWLVSGFDYLLDGEWRRHREDMSWRALVPREVMPEE